FLSFTTPPPPRSPLFPYTTLFRSGEGDLARREGRVEDALAAYERAAAADRASVRAHLRVVETLLGEGRRTEARERYAALVARPEDRKSTRLNASHLVISYAVFCLK